MVYAMKCCVVKRMIVVVLCCGTTCVVVQNDKRMIEIQVYLSTYVYIREVKF